MKLEGFKPVIISTPYIDRLISRDTSATAKLQMTAFAYRQSGHTFYILNCRTLDKTFACNLTNNTWAEWRSVIFLQATNPVTVTINPITGVRQCLATAHGLATGDLVTLAGLSPTEFNDTAPCYVVDVNNFTMPTTVYNVPITVGVGTWSMIKSEMYLGRYGTNGAQNNTATVYVINPNNTSANNRVFKPDEFNSTEMDTSLFNVIMSVKTPNIDAQLLDNKNVYSLELVGDKPDTLSGAIIPVYISFTDNDFTGWTPFRIVPQNRLRSIIRRLGAGRRRAFWIIYFGSLHYRMKELELKIEHGDS